jgi:hypothetical protein
VASWREVEAAAPELAALKRRYLDGGVDKTIATCRGIRGGGVTRRER